ncbi:MAG: hypothetical protein JNL79_34440 [Myxococcales bacterium]|nr:hypothetical protein [Myxococcales bacterium]
MDRRSFLASLVASSTPVLLGGSVLGCKSKAQKQAELAVTDLDGVLDVIEKRHVQGLARALPQAAKDLGAKLAGVELDKEAVAFVAIRDKVDDLRSAKRSYFAVVDQGGEVQWVDDPNWPVVHRKIAVGFPAVQEVLDGKSPFAKGIGRYGGADEAATTFVEAAPLAKADGTKLGALVACWEAHDAAEDLRRQLLTQLLQKTAQPMKRVKAKDKLKLMLDQPDVWVGIFRGQWLYLQEDAPQPLEEALQALAFADKTKAGAWSGTFDVMNKGWGGAAKRVPSLGADVGVVVARLDP